MRRTPPRLRLARVLLVLLLSLAGCRPAWQVELARPQGAVAQVDRNTLAGLRAYREESGDGSLLPLERVLAATGHLSVERLVAVEPGSVRHEYTWAEVAEQAWWLDSGRLRMATDEFPATQLEVASSAYATQVQASLIDVAPTVAAALGLPAPAAATGRSLDAPPAPRAAIVVLDGFGYLHYVEALDAGLLPNLAALGPALLGRTVYPPITTVATASLLTGAPPEVHGADRRGIRQTETETLLEVVTDAGRRVVAVEGESLAFNLRGAQVQLSGDRNGDGSTDDEVLANALAVLAAPAPDLTPDIFFVHLHGIDDAGHTYGPSSPEVAARVQAADAAVGQIMAALPAGTLVVIVADHGMHAVEEEGRLGNHGHLIERDMFIPIFVTQK